MVQDGLCCIFQKIFDCNAQNDRDVYPLVDVNIFEVVKALFDTVVEHTVLAKEVNKYLQYRRRKVKSLLKQVSPLLKVAAGLAQNGIQFLSQERKLEARLGVAENNESHMDCELDEQKDKFLAMLSTEKLGKPKAHMPKEVDVQQLTGCKLQLANFIFKIISVAIGCQ